MEIRTEYGLINKLPDGCTIDDVEVGNRWLYDTAFQVHQTGSETLGKIWADQLAKQAEDLNQQRELVDYGVAVNNRDYSLIIPGTVAVVCKRTVTYGDWEEVTE